MIKLFILVPLLLLSSCKEEYKEFKPITPKPSSSRMKFHYEGKLAQNELSLYLESNEVTEITLEPINYYEAQRTYHRVFSAYHASSNKAHEIQCQIHGYKFQEMKELFIVPSQALYRKKDFVKVEGKVVSNSRHLTTTYEDGVIKIKFDNSYFQVREIVLINPTIKDVPELYFDLSRCADYKTHHNYRHLNEYGGASSVAKEYVTFLYQIN